METAMTPPPPNGRPEPPPGRAVTEIEVKVTTQGDGVTITVSPWEAKVEPDTAIQWKIDGADTILIEPKNPGKWPFPGKPRPGNPTLPAKAGKVDKNAKHDDRFPYSIVLIAGDLRVDIDPDIVIFDPS
jgi:hypothetical protein